MNKAITIKAGENEIRLLKKVKIVYSCPAWKFLHDAFEYYKKSKEYKEKYGDVDKYD